MKSILVFGTTLLCALLTTLTVTSANAATNKRARLMRDIPHMDLEMSGYEYRRLLHPPKQKGLMVFQIGEIPKDAEDKILDVYIKFGERNLQWLDLVNKNRPAAQRISLTSEATAHGYPITNARALNLAGVTGDWEVLRALMPLALKKVIFDGDAMPTKLPVSDREFIEWCRQVDDAYQNSARLSMLKAYKDELKSIAIYDVRGFVKLNGDRDLETKLTDWENLSELQRISLSNSLVMICRNFEVAENICRAELALAVATKTVVAFKNKYWPNALALYNSFFDIPISRIDVNWTSAQPNFFSIPFANPNNNAVLDFLRLNIEDEFKWNGWQLRLNFIDTPSLDTTHIVFEAGSTPHVNDIAGSEITMDGNAPLSEYDVQWTIRHEYGHVLGFPDCYFEFYDENVDAYVSYQLDVTNLMCSRRGHFQQRHFDQLKWAYFK